MKNKLITLILSGIICVLLCMTVSADTKEYVFDDTGRFTADEMAAYNIRAAEIVENYDVAPYFVVVNEGEGANAVQLTEDFYEEHASGTNCLIMLLTEDTYYVLPIGVPVDIFEYQEEVLYDAFYMKIYQGESYASGAMSYLDCVEEIIVDYNSSQSLPGATVDSNAGNRVIDNADILEPIFESTMSIKLDEISTTYKCDVVFVTVPSTYGTGVSYFADDYYDFNGYGFGSEYDGILFLVSMEERKWAFSTCGNAMNIFNDDVLAYMEDEVVSYLRRNKYEDALDKYVTLCEKFISDAENGITYNVESLPKSYFGFKAIIFAIVIGAIVAVVVVFALKAQLKSVKKKVGARDYMKDGSIKLSESRDSFLYSHVSRRAKPQSSSSGSGGSHRSSSGRSHGGRSGGF